MTARTTAVLIPLLAIEHVTRNRDTIQTLRGAKNEVPRQQRPVGNHRHRPQPQPLFAVVDSVDQEAGMHEWLAAGEDDAFHPGLFEEEEAAFDVVEGLDVRGGFDSVGAEVALGVAFGGDAVFD